MGYIEHSRDALLINHPKASTPCLAGRQGDQPDEISHFSDSLFAAY